jgi:hypothetical protein
MIEFLIGQRVIVYDREIGTVVKPEGPSTFDVWVRLSSNGYASCYSAHNVKPLPNGQL